MSGLIVSRQRDAYSVIKGFVYQIELTIDRWLKLKTNQILELEAGEDIDIVQKAFTEKRATNFERILEQVKERQKNLTLRSAPARAALASFHEHSENNPKKNFKFHYVTNAKIGRERPSPMPDKTPVIEIWEKIRNRELNMPDILSLTKKIQEFLAKTSTPDKDFNKQTWDNFIKYIKSATSEEILKFIDNVQWFTSQTDPELLKDSIQEQIVGKFKVDINAAEKIYIKLFHHIFKNLTVSGIKSLDVKTLKSLVTDESLDHADEKLINFVFTKLNGLEALVESHEERIKRLEESKPKNPDAKDIRQAIEKITLSTIKEIVGDRKIIPRLSFDSEITNFLDDTIRYFFTVGVSGVGKSCALASEARKLIDAEHTALFLKLPTKKSFTLDYLANEICRHFSISLIQVNWFQLLDILLPDKGNGFIEENKFIILLDEIEETDIDHFVTQLKDLHRSLLRIHQTKIKIICSCKNPEFVGIFKKEIDLFLRQLKSGEDKTDNTYQFFEVSDFSNSELDNALQKIGASNLVNVRDESGNVDFHLASVRAILKHPATFDHFASLFSEEKLELTEGETWSTLLERRLDYILPHIQKASGVDMDVLQKELESFAEICRKLKASDMSVELQLVKKKFPRWFKVINAGKKSIYESFQIYGLIHEKKGKDDQYLTSFQIKDMGGYLLSFSVEKELILVDDNKTCENTKKIIDESWEFSTIMDALLSVIDRVVITNQKNKLIPVFEELTSRHNNLDLFHLMRPDVLQLLFKILKRVGSEHYYDLKQAIFEVRYSSQNKHLIKEYLSDPNHQVREAAVRLIGKWAKSEFAEDLADRLPNEPEQDVQTEIYQAFGKLGSLAIDALLPILNDKNTPPGNLREVTYALRNIGYWDKSVSSAITKVIKKATKLGDDELVKDSLFVAAHLRDRNQSSLAIDFLLNSDMQIVQAAAKYFTEVPYKPAYIPLKNVLFNLTKIKAKDHAQSSARNQIIAALLKVDRTRALKDLKGFFSLALQEKSISLMELKRLTIKHALGFNYSFLLTYIVDELKTELPHKFVGSITNDLNSIWKINALNNLSKSAAQIEKGGNDLSLIVVNEIKPHVHISEYKMGDKLNRVADTEFLIKCQSADFISQSKRLLENTMPLGTRKLGDFFWIIGNTSVEKELIKKFKMMDRTDKLNRIAYDSIIRALGTCGTVSGSKLVLSFLKTESDISLYFPQETLLPLLIRKIISPEILVKQIQDKKMSDVGRATSLAAIADFNAQNFTDLFIDGLDNDDSSLTFYYSLQALGFTKNSSAVNKLREILRSNTRFGIKSVAAEALMHLNAKEAYKDVEEAFEESVDDDNNPLPTQRFLNALTNFKGDSMLKILLDRLNSITRFSKGKYLEAIALYSDKPDIESLLIKSLEDSISNYSDHFYEQSTIINGMISSIKNPYKESILNHLLNGRLSENSRLELAYSIWILLRNKKENLTFIFEIMKFLLCDKNIQIRQITLHNLRLLDKSFCRKIYSALITSPDEWTNLCAIESLGYWESESKELQKAVYSSYLLARKAADRAIRQRENYNSMLKHVEQYFKGKELLRLRSYQCLASHGDITTIRELNKTTVKDSIPNIYLRSLKHRINEQIREKYREIEKEQKELDRRGTIWFD